MKLSHYLFSPILICLVLYSCQTENSAPKTDELSINIIDNRVDSLGIELPKISSPIANYVNLVVAGDLVFLAGKGPKDDNGEYIKGKLGKDLTVKQGYDAARRVAIMQLSVLKNELGSLDHIKRIVKVRGMVNATDDFEQHPEVINGYSDLMVEVFGESGKHARAAVGMASLPRNIACEIEMIVQLKKNYKKN